MRYTVTVKPGSSQEKIVTTGDHELTVYLHAKPVDGTANDALIKILSKHFDVPKTSISIIRGHKSRIKTIDIFDGN
ncbi:DUF167 domain-containing protein [Candidatus Saccharibacteria bacterium]|nr:DUF167 domain-containing protein [Candidatus Saccharibacteria bacterium]